MISKGLVKKFEQVVGKGNVLQDETDRMTYSYDAAVLEPALPSIVLRPTSSEALARWWGFATKTLCRPPSAGPVPISVAAPSPRSVA